MLLVLFEPGIFYDSRSIEFSPNYKANAAAVFGYCIFDSILVLTFIGAIYFKIVKLRRFLSKYWCVRIITIIVVDVLLALLLYERSASGLDSLLLALLVLVVSHAALLTWSLKKKVRFILIQTSLLSQMFVWKAWRASPLGDQQVPDCPQVQQAVWIMDMKEEVKQVVRTAGAA